MDRVDLCQTHCKQVPDFSRPSGSDQINTCGFPPARTPGACPVEVRKWGMQYGTLSLALYRGLHRGPRPCQLHCADGYCCTHQHSQALPVT